jgi:hypothetical protein
MVKVPLEAFECDECGNPATRYLVEYPDGQLALDRCETHEREILKLKKQKGTWIPRGGKANFKVSTPEEIEQQRLK